MKHKLLILTLRGKHGFYSESRNRNPPWSVPVT